MFAIVRRISLLSIALALILLQTSAAFACPPNTVFSAYNGRGLCLVPGEGLEPVAECFIKKVSCPANFVTRHKATDPNNDFCCPTVKRNIRQCEKSCKPLLKIEDYNERMRVYRNCVVGCNFGRNKLICDDGRLIHSNGQCAGRISKPKP